MIMVKTLLLQTETSYIWRHNGSINATQFINIHLLLFSQCKSLLMQTILSTPIFH